MDFERWAHDILEAAAGFPGRLGASWARAKDRYQVIYRFADQRRFHEWHESSVRAAFLKRLQPIARLATDEHRTGPETWFELPDDPGRPGPPRWKMVVVTWLGVAPLLGVVQWQVAPHLNGLPLPIRAVTFTPIVVATMSYMVMPRLTAIFKPWLYPVGTERTCGENAAIAAMLMLWFLAWLS